MNSSGRRSGLILGLIVVVIVLAGGGYYGGRAWAKHDQSATRTSLSVGYATQPLGAPFTLTAKSWQPNSGPFATSGQWQYTYTTTLSEPAALAAAKAQFGSGAYQVVATQPDVIGATQATLYRDLITEDVALKIQIAPTTVTVTLTPQAG